MQSHLVGHLPFLSRAQWRGGRSESCSPTVWMGLRDCWAGRLALKDRDFEESKGKCQVKWCFKEWVLRACVKAFSMISSAFEPRGKTRKGHLVRLGEEHSFLSGAWHEFSKDSKTCPSSLSKCLNQQNTFRMNLAWTARSRRFASLKCLLSFPCNKSGFSGG